MRSLLKKILPGPVADGLRTLRDLPTRTLQSVMDSCGYVIARKSDYYSPLPSREALRPTMARWSAPTALRGVDYDLTAMKAVLAELLQTYSAEFLALPPYSEIVTHGFGPGYPQLDAHVLYCMIRAKKPSRYIEVGSGLSTYYASLAAAKNAAEGRPMQITCIEPYPFPKLSTIPGITIIPKKVEDVGLEIFHSLGEDDILFIDSSHVVRLDGDVPFLFLEVLPSLRPGVIIHIHDIPFPYQCPYPAELWIYGRLWPMWWNESILLHALLVGNKELTMTLSTPLIRHHDEPFLKQLFSGYRTVQEEPNTFSSIWLKRP